MNLYQLIEGLIAALNANTAAHAGGAAASTGTASTGQTAAEKKAAKAAAEKAAAASKGPSREDVVAALTEVKEKFGAAEAKAIITKVGAAKMAEIDDDQLGKAFDLAQKKLKTADADDAGEDDGL